jgi:hypothetical protein
MIDSAKVHKQHTLLQRALANEEPPTSNLQPPTKVCRMHIDYEKLQLETKRLTDGHAALEAKMGELHASHTIDMSGIDINKKNAVLMAHKFEKSHQKHSTPNGHHSVRALLAEKLGLPCDGIEGKLVTAYITACRPYVGAMVAGIAGAAGVVAYSDGELVLRRIDWQGKAARQPCTKRGDAGDRYHGQQQASGARALAIRARVDGGVRSARPTCRRQSVVAAVAVRAPREACDGSLEPPRAVGEA